MLSIFGGDSVLKIRVNLQYITCGCAFIKGKKICAKFRTCSGFSDLQHVHFYLSNHTSQCRGENLQQNPHVTLCLGFFAKSVAGRTSIHMA